MATCANAPDQGSQVMQGGPSERRRRRMLFEDAIGGRFCRAASRFVVRRNEQRRVRRIFSSRRLPARRSCKGFPRKQYRRDGATGSRHVRMPSNASSKLAVDHRYAALTPVLVRVTLERHCQAA